MGEPSHKPMGPPWKLRICRECGGHHGRLHDGCVTYGNPLFPQMTEYAGVDEVEVVPVRDVERATMVRDRCDNSSPGYARGYRDALADARAALGIPQEGNEQ